MEKRREGGEVKQEVMGPGSPTQQLIREQLRIAIKEGRNKVDFDRWHAWKIEDFMRCKTPEELIAFCEQTANWLKENKEKIEWVFKEE